MAGTGDLCSCLRSASDASCCPLLWAGWAGCLAVGQQNVENKPRGSGEAKRTERQKERLPEQPCSPGSPRLSRPAWAAAACPPPCCGLRVCPGRSWVGVWGGLLEMEAAGRGPLGWPSVLSPLVGEAR